MKKAAGLDVNGWRDHVARNWTTLPGEGERIGEIQCGSAGPLTSVVQIGEGSAVRWMGGPPADLAPHGRGGGWGRIGEESRRLFVRDLIEGRTGGPKQLSATFATFVRRASHTVLAIEDSPDSTDEVRERLLNGLSAARCRNPALVWRTVLAALYAIDRGMVQETCTIGVVSHVSAGLSVQKLRIRQAGTRSGLLVPERSRGAMVLESASGMRGLVTQARRAAVGTGGFTSRTAHRAMARSVGRVALGMPREPEIVRLHTGHWEEIDFREDLSPDPVLTGEPVDLSGCAKVLFETLTEGSVRVKMETLVRQTGLRIDETLPPDAVAQGALVAALRMGTGDPVYFDFLPRISTIVVGRDGAANYDLIDEAETLEAGRVYRSPRPAKLAIPKGFDEISIHLRKDAAPHPRKATVRLDAALSADTPVSVWVEQKPAAERARIVMEAPALSRNFQVDWENAEDDTRDWDAIIASFDAPLPSIPDRMVLPCGTEAWEESNRSPGMLGLLDEAAKSGSPDWLLLAQKAMARPFGKYCVSSDGDLPVGLPDDAKMSLDEVTWAAIALTRERLEAGRDRAARDNSALQFLTWQFRRCPPEVGDWLLDCIDSHGGRTGTHPFVWHDSNWMLVYQGLARTVRGGEIEARVLRAILDRDPDTWNWRKESACLALLLSRSETAPLLLSRRDIECIARRVIDETTDELGSDYTRFYYAGLLAGGLLRCRLTDPNALLAGRDPLGDRLYDVIDSARLDLLKRRKPSASLARKRDKYVPILEQILDYIRGEGGNPNLLLDLYDT